MNMNKVMIASVFAISFGLASYATIEPTAVWTNNLDTVQNGYTITLGEGCSIANGMAVVGSSGGISIDMGNLPSSVSVLVKYSNCKPQSASSVAISAAVQATSGSASHELGVRSSASNSNSITGYWESGSDFSFGAMTLPESGYMLFSTSSSDGTRVYVGSKISSLAGGENTSLRFMNTGFSRITIGAATGTQSGISYSSWNGLAIERIAIFETYCLSNVDVRDFVFIEGDETPASSPTIAEALDENIGTYSFSGVSDWYVDESVAHNGSCSMRSGAVPADSVWKSSAMIMSIDVKVPTRILFWYKVSCYNSTSCAKLNINVDNVSYDYAGEKDWTQMTQVLLPGQHTITWSFMRNYNSSGSNCAWVDDISIEPIMPDASKVEVTNIKCQQRYPWNGMVDIDYTVTSDDPNADVWVYPIGYDKDSNTSMAPRALTGDGVNAPVKAGTHRMTWTVTEDYPDFHSTAFTVKMIALVGAAPYMVVDLSGGVDALSYPVSYLSSVPEGGWGDEYKTTKLVLRLIPPGSFMMGSPSDETGRGSYEDLHGVVLTKPFYIGVFEVTQKQYQLVMGSNPSSRKGDMRPVEQVSYNNIRGSVNGAGWPTHNQVDANSFMGRLRSKVNMLFDLPTEAQWEYACRAGTTAALNSGKSYDGGNNCNEVARWNGNRSDGKGGYTDYTTKVGSYRENMWGLYDMHGNIWELCRDFFNGGLGSGVVIDPKGASTGYWGANRSRSRRGGWAGDGSAIRSAFRDSCQDPGTQDAGVGFRVFCSPVAE